MRRTHADRRLHGALAALAALAIAFGSNTASATNDAGTLTLQPYRGVPDGFQDHYFNTPLAVRVVVNGVSIGNAMIVLTKDDRVHIVHTIDDPDSHADVWAKLMVALEKSTPLGPCGNTRCAAPLQELAFDTRTSTLHIAISTPTSATTTTTVAEPLNGHGLLIHPSVSVVGEGHATAATATLDLLGSIDRWTAVLAARYSRTPFYNESSLQSAFVERELDRHRVRAGYVQPDNTGLYRPVNTLGSPSVPLLGVMIGSSDTRRNGAGVASAYPVYVSSSRAAIVEVYRDGQLIHAQAVSSGLQPLDTRTWPNGIYTVELRVVEDGAAARTQTQLVYKPGSWNDTSRRWRYHAYAGYDPAVDRWSAQPREGAATGASLNYLIHPRAVLGLGVDHHAGDASATASVDIEATPWASAFVNVHRGSNRRNGVDLHWAMRAQGTSVVLGAGTYGDADVRRHFGSITAMRSLDQRTQWTVRSTRTGRAGEASHEVALHRRWQTRGAYVTSRLTAFDRPSTGRGGDRDRGVEWRWSMTFNASRQTVGTTVRTARRSSAGVDVERRSDDALNLASGFLSRDASGTSAGVAANVDTAHGNGSLFIQATPEGRVAGGLNIESHHAFGGGRMASTGGTHLRLAHAVMMIDVISDDGDVRLEAQDTQGRRHALHAGRNTIELATFQPGAITLSAEGMHLDRRRIAYHVRRGEVVLAAVRVSVTQAVLGQLVDGEGRPIVGAAVTTGAGQTVSGADGLFSLDVARGAPALAVLVDGQRQCTIEVAMPARGTSMHMLGVVPCRAGDSEAAAGVQL